METRLLLFRTAFVFILIVNLQLQYYICETIPRKFYLDVTDGKNKEEMEALKFAFEDAKKNFSFTLDILNLTHSNDLYQYVSSLLKTDTVALIDGVRPRVPVCSVSTVSKLPFFRLHHSKHDFLQAAMCKYGLQMTPDEKTYALAAVDLLKAFPSKKAVVLYQGSNFHGVTEFQSVIAGKLSTVLYYIRLDEYSDDSLKDSAKRAVREIMALDVDTILLYADANYWPFLLVEEHSPKKVFKWIIQSDIPLNITAAANSVVLGFRLPRIRSNKTLELVDHIKRETRNPDISLDSIQESSLLAYDTILVIVDALLSNQSSPSNGDVLLSHYKQTKIVGLTGPVQFDITGKRNVLRFDILNLRANKFHKVAFYRNYDSKIVFEDNVTKNMVSAGPAKKVIKGRHFKVVTVEVHPFIIRGKGEDGGVTYEGYCIDLLNKLAEQLQFTFEIYESPGGSYGSFINGKWNGMIKEIIDQNADMAAAAMTVTEQRSQVVAFTPAYMHYTEDMLMKKERSDKSRLFQFLDPFDTEVWLMLLAALFVCTVCIFIIGHLSPYEYKDEQEIGTGNAFSLSDSLWFSAACMLQQGADHTPRSMSGRILAGCFWFCILVWISTYTANLAAFLTVKNANTPIRNIEDAASSDYSIGVTRSTSLYSYFQTTDYPLYRAMWSRMQGEDTFPNNTMMGINWVRTKKKYIHIADAPILKYASKRRPCDVETVPGLTAARGLAFALNVDDPAKRNISLAMLRLRDKGFLSSLERKWWEERSECPKEDQSTLSKKRIQLVSMVGVYIVLGGGIIFAFIALGGEIWWHRRQRRKFVRNDSKVELEVLTQIPTDNMNGSVIVNSEESTKMLQKQSSDSLQTNVV